MEQEQLMPKPSQTQERGIRLLSGSIAAFILFCGLGFSLLYRPASNPPPQETATAVSTTATGASTNELGGPVALKPEIAHVPLPDEVRGIYWTAWTAGSRRADGLLAYASSSHLNSIVIDLKLDGGELAFAPDDPALKGLVGKELAIGDLDALLKRLKDAGLYRIARIAVMRDGSLGKLFPDIVLRDAGGEVWRDNTGVAWLDPAAPQVVDYSLALAREAYGRGFDEIQFDYVRFASDGRLSAIRYPVYDGKRTKAEVMRYFFERVGGTLQEEGIPVSFDLFGLTFCTSDDLNIGQRLADAYPSADFVSPMAYPSHYARGFEGFANPALFPYEVVKRTLDKGIGMMLASDPPPDTAALKKKIRPWIQDFNLGAKYDAAKVKAQIKAARDAGASGWLIWNASNVYTQTDYLK